MNKKLVCMLLVSSGFRPTLAQLNESDTTRHYLIDNHLRLYYDALIGNPMNTSKPLIFITLALLARMVGARPLSFTQMNPNQ